MSFKIRFWKKIWKILSFLLSILSILRSYSFLRTTNDSDQWFSFNHLILKYIVIWLTEKFAATSENTFQAFSELITGFFFQKIWNFFSKTKNLFFWNDFVDCWNLVHCSSNCRVFSFVVLNLIFLITDLLPNILSKTEYQKVISSKLRQYYQFDK